MNGIKYLLDTNMVIGLLKGYPIAVSLAEEAGFVLQQGAVSQITRMELLAYPKLSEEEETVILRFLGACQVQLLSEAIETLAIQLRRKTGLKLPDAIVAATAIHHGLRLLTLDQGIVNALARWSDAA